MTLSPFQYLMITILIGAVMAGTVAVYIYSQTGGQ